MKAAQFLNKVWMAGIVAKVMAQQEYLRHHPVTIQPGVRRVISISIIQRVASWLNAPAIMQ
jgi:hypothetical protein